MTRWWGILLVVISSGCGASVVASRPTTDTQQAFHVRMDVAQSRDRVTEARDTLAHNPYARPPASPYAELPASPYMDVAPSYSELPASPYVDLPPSPY